MIHILFVLGTRPEAIKLAPVIRCLLADREQFHVRVTVTGQHRDLLDQTLGVFGMQPDDDLNVMQPGQTLTGVTSRILAALEPVLLDFRATAGQQPCMAIVQGDTTTTFCGALAAFYAGIPVAHVEAGLRTGDISQPFPEEMNRAMAGRLATLHFPPTAMAAANLRLESVDPNRIFVTGNTGIDAVLAVRDGLESGTIQLDESGSLADLDTGRKLILVTAHRRESFGPGFDGICSALNRLASRPDVRIVYPVHPNPNVREVVARRLGSHPNIQLIDPLPYVPFVDLMGRAHVLLTDSGGIQEEGPSLGKPVLVMRDKTERPEAVDAGTARLTGTEPDRIVAEVEQLLDDPAEYERRRKIHNPYGDGRASARIRQHILDFFSTR